MLFYYRHGTFIIDIVLYYIHCISYYTFHFYFRHCTFIIYISIVHLLYMLYFHYIHCTLLYALYIYFIHCTSLYTLCVYYMHWTFIIDIVLLSFTLKFYYRHFSFIIYIVLSDFQSQSHRLLVNICLNSQTFIFFKSNLNNETHLDIHENLLRIAWPH